jgi:F1F0 ATPase subunit 2
MSVSAFALLAGALAGAALGALYLALLWASVRALAGPRPAAGFVALAVARAALVLGALAVALKLGVGAGALLAALAGFVAVRFAATRRARITERGPAWK